MELTKYYAVVALSTTGGTRKPRSSADDSTQDVKHYVCQLIDTVSQRLAFLQSAASLFPQGAQMLALLSPPSPPSPSFCPDNICTAVLSAATYRRELHNPLLNCWQLGAGRHRWQKGVSGDCHWVEGGGRYRPGLPSGLGAGTLPQGIFNVYSTESLSGVGSHLAQNVVLSGRFHWSWRGDEGGGGGRMQQSELISQDSGRKRTGTD